MEHADKVRCLDELSSLPIRRNGHLSGCEPTGVRYGAVWVRANPRAREGSRMYRCAAPWHRASLKRRETSLPKVPVISIVDDDELVRAATSARS